METVQIVIEKELLQATDRAARRTRLNRSALVREALREHLRRLEMRALEERDREGYAKQAAKPDEFRPWEAEAAWPSESSAAKSGSTISLRPTRKDLFWC